LENKVLNFFDANVNNELSTCRFGMLNIANIWNLFKEQEFYIDLLLSYLHKTFRLFGAKLFGYLAVFIIDGSKK
jgi:hypothetical protein